jgi:hypothetical protein
MRDEQGGRLEFHRPFHWGIVVVGDRESTDIPEIRPDELVASSASEVVVPVRHAQDVEVVGRQDEEIPFFEVSVSCSPGVVEGQELRFDGIVTLPRSRAARPLRTCAHLVQLGAVGADRVRQITRYRTRTSMPPDSTDRHVRVRIFWLGVR